MNSPQDLIKITTDSRAVKPGVTFIAIQGDTFDGHQFIPQAVAKGATEIVAETKKLTPELRNSVPPAVKLTEVPSCMDEIRRRAHAYRKTFSIPFIAVVGAVGKTTTKELLWSLLQGKYNSPNAVLKTEGSNNGFLGIPLTLLNLSQETQIAVIEIGIDDIGAMEQHLALVEPTHVIMTAIGPEHLHQLKTVELAAKEELKAFDYALSKSLPMAINLSDEYVQKWVGAHAQNLESPQSKIITKTYALSTVNLTNHVLPTEFTQPNFIGKYQAQKDTLTVLRDGQSIHVQVPLPGEHHAHNLLAAITMSQFFNLSREQILAGLATFKTAYGRTEIYSLPSGTQVIGDYYNSNPTSATAALKLLHEKTVAPGQSHAVLGDMLELGDAEESFHRSLAEVILQEKINNVWLYGPRMKWLQDELTRTKNALLTLQHFETHEALTAALKPKVGEKDTILIKGSRGMKMENILKALS